MKNIKLLSLAAVLGLGSFFLTNCGTGEEVAPKPTLEFIGGSSYVSGDISLAGSSGFTVGLNASHTAKMVSLKITVSYDGEPEVIDPNCTLCDTVIDTRDLRVDFTGKTRAAAGTEVWNFTLADKDGNSTTKSITITNLGTGGASLIEYTQDNGGQPLRVWNFIGPNAGAYDLKIGGNLFSADANSDKDIQDSMNLNDKTAWAARWTSRNGTTFKKVTGYSWGAVTNSSQLQAAWDDSGAEFSTFTVVKGASYMAKLRGTSTLVFIEITDVVTTASNNLDYAQFRYKKAP
jgi:hypothetical protein